MIRHRPYGSEHPYAQTADQRTPAFPEIGDRVTLGVSSASDVIEIICEWTVCEDGNTRTQQLPLQPVTADASQGAAHSGGEGHLAVAQAKAARTGSRSWSVQAPKIIAGARYSYRFLANNSAGTQRRSKIFHIDAGSWSTEAAGSELRLDSDRLIPGSIRWRRNSAGVQKVRFGLRLEPGEHVVGFGERFDRVDQRGNQLDAVVFEQYKSQGRFGRTYLPMPFAHVIGDTGRGWGFHLRTSRRSWYDVAASTADALIIEAELAGEPVGDLEVAIYRGNPTQVLDGFLNDVGRAQELPDWVFGLWASGNEWNTQSLVMARMDRHRELDIPVGAVVIEAWSDEEGITIFRDADYTVTEDGAAHQGDDFTYPPDGAWPNPKQMIDDLHAQGVKVMLWQIPLQKMRPHPKGQAKADANAMIANDHVVREADGRPYRNRGWWFPQALMPDLSTQRTRDWWTDKRRYLITDLDIDGFKTDGGEHAWGHDLRYGDGRRGADGNNLFPVHYARAFGDLLRSEGKAPVTFSRAGFTGSQAHGIIWAGDEDSTWEAFRSSITAGLTASSCGIVYWSWDLGGFSGSVPDAELYLRACAAATFMPVMQYHSEFNHHRLPLRDRTPWHVQDTTGDDHVIPVFRRFAKIRQALIPYLAHQARLSIDDGRPLMRPLFFDHGADPHIWDHQQQYQLGDDILINPVTEPGQTQGTTYLPDGKWIDAFTGESLDGGRTHTRPTPIDEIPVYVRAESWPNLADRFTSVP